MSTPLKRWAPPRPLVGSRVIEKVLRRHASVSYTHLTLPTSDLV